MRTALTAIMKVTALAVWLSVSVSGQAVLATLSGDLLALLLGGQQILWGDQTLGLQILWGDTVRGQ